MKTFSLRKLSESYRVVVYEVIVIYIDLNNFQSDFIVILYLETDRNFGSTEEFLKQFYCSVLGLITTWNNVDNLRKEAISELSLVSLSLWTDCLISLFVTRKNCSTLAHLRQSAKCNYALQSTSGKQSLVHPKGLLGVRCLQKLWMERTSSLLRDNADQGQSSLPRANNFIFNPQLNFGLCEGEYYGVVGHVGYAVAEQRSCFVRRVSFDK
ncbi:hypothetical protein P5673_020293 [Acropora cervicornis]|uniref:Uncharacterized protein n=1 Tax=Acropora cervicornis TaxID=6130 RepID=A0AAD9V1R0_ACRCE|nr:hypothetical protein P5673_020293 [Acropora cervicornis]